MIVGVSLVWWSERLQPKATPQRLGAQVDKMRKRPGHTQEAGRNLDKVKKILNELPFIPRKSSPAAKRQNERAGGGRPYMRGWTVNSLASKVGGGAAA